MSPTLSPIILLPGIGMMAVSIAFIVYSLRRGGTWGYLGLGALAWVVTVVVKFMIAISLNQPIYQALVDPNTLWAPGSILFYLYVGALTGFTEVLMSWLLLRYTRLSRVTWGKALAFGVGFGTFEALLLGFSNLSASILALVNPQAVAEALNALARTNDPLYGLAPVAERLATIFVHIFCNVLLFYGVLSGKARWMWISLLYKSLLDSVAGFAQLWGIETIGKLWTIEAFVLLFGVIAWWGIQKVRQNYEQLRNTDTNMPLGQPAVEIG